MNYTKFPDSEKNRAASRSCCIWVFFSIILLLVLVLTLTVLIIIGVFHGRKHPYDGELIRMCYYRWTNQGLAPEAINATYCTHVIFAFATVANGTLQPDDENFRRTVALKDSFPHLKVTLSTGENLGEVSSTEENIDRFVSSAISLLREYGFDGLDLDWEFPAWNGGSPSERQNFINLLKSLRSGFEEESAETNQTSLLLTTAVAAPLTIVEVSYDVPGMAQYVDFINLMTYDFNDFKPYTPWTGYNSPLFKRSTEIPYFNTLNTEFAANLWVDKGMPESKILVGLPTYGHMYKLLAEFWHGVHDPAVAGGPDYTYPQVCQLLQEGGTRVFDKESQVPYAYKDFTWVSYDDVESITAKVNWVKSQGFAGVFTFDLNCDDFDQICPDSTEPFPLHLAMYKTVVGK